VFGFFFGTAVEVILGLVRWGGAVIVCFTGKLDLAFFVLVEDADTVAVAVAVVVVEGYTGQPSHPT
jgi:hypothetical protein